MRRCLYLALALACILAAWCCEQQNGCKITENNCICMYGCRLEYIYKTRRECNNALRAMRATAPPPAEWAANICSSRPCLRGTCLQTSNAPGYACKCEGTGFYGQRCERACPTSGLVRDMVFPHECVVI